MPIFNILYHIVVLESTSNLVKIFNYFGERTLSSKLSIFVLLAGNTRHPDERPIKKYSYVNYF